MLASLAQRNTQPATALPPLLVPDGARVILGARPADPVAPIVPTTNSLFAPRGACLATPSGPLVVCDTGHHRLLIWKEVPNCDVTPADLLVGQVDFSAEGRNARGEPGPATLNVPTGIAANDKLLAVADAWNHRILIWHGIPDRPNQPADVVLGQADFESTSANRCLERPRADTLNWPYGVAFCDGRLYVADTGNRRVLVWESIPQTNGKPADLVVEEKMSWPHGIAAHGQRLWVADAGSSQILCWDNLASLERWSEHVYMPYGVALASDSIVVADTANSRLLGFGVDGGPPRRLAGQRTLADKGENRWRTAARDSVSWPYCVAACGRVLVVADTGNHRVLLWNMA